MDKTTRLVHDLLNELQALQGFIELASDNEKSIEVQNYLKQARAQLKPIFVNVRRIKKILDNRNE